MHRRLFLLVPIALPIRLICRLSKEDKYFARYVSCMFGLTEMEGSTPLKALESVAIEVQATSVKVPLWILADYIRDEYPQHEDAANVLDKICVAIKISSKGNNEELLRSDSAVK